MLGNSVVNAMVSSWRRARLSAMIGTVSGYSSVNSIYRWMRFGMQKPERTYIFSERVNEVQKVSDAEIVQQWVQRMPEEMRTVFEAYHIALIRGERCLKHPHKARAATLGISRSTYYERVKAAHSYLRMNLELEENYRGS